jgi:hypothetical protein
VSAQPQPPGQDPESIHCPRCSAPVGADQDWCLECGAPARTRLAQTPNWQLPTVAIGAIVLLAGALLAFAFVKLTNDSNATPAAATTATSTAPPVATTPVAPVPPPVATTVPTPTTTAPVAPTTVPGQTTTVPGQTTTPVAPPPAATAGGQKTTPPFGATTTTP